MSKKVEHIDNQYTSERNRKKQRQQNECVSFVEE